MAEGIPDTLSRPSRVRPAKIRGSRKSNSWSSAPLPDDVVRQTCRRIGTVAMVFASMWAFGLMVNTVLARAAPGMVPLVPHWPVPGAWVVSAGLALSLALLAAARLLGDRPAVLLNLGLGFEVATALLIGILNQWEPRLDPMSLSWVILVILVYPSIVPNTPGKTFVTAFAAASMDPLGLGLAVARGVPVPEAFGPNGWVWVFLPNYMAALLAVIPAQVIRGLAGQVRRARELGSYKLGESLGVGGMGEVFRAEHRLLARPAAIKVIRTELRGMAADVMIERFRREAEASAVLRSPHTIELYDFGSAADGTFYYVMEHLDGIGLEDLVDRFGPVPAERAVYLGLQICESLGEAHMRGLIHRDIKPSNIYASRLGLQVDFIKVLDFGLVKAQPGSQYEALSLTAPEIATGTPAFMAPEVAQGDRDTDHRIDIYALGTVLYWLLTGQLVFEAENVLMMMDKQVHEIPVVPSKRTELPIPAELDDLVMDCLAKKRTNRPGDALTLSRRLQAITFDRPWTPERARKWWSAHLPSSDETDAVYEQGALVPAMEPE